jgi:hypothetical protein
VWTIASQPIVEGQKHCDVRCEDVAGISPSAELCFEPPVMAENAPLAALPLLLAGLLTPGISKRWLGSGEEATHVGEQNFIGIEQDRCLSAPA